MAAVLILGWSGCIIINDDDAPFSDCLDGRGNIVSTVYELSPFNEIELLGDVELICRLKAEALPVCFLLRKRALRPEMRF